MWYLRKVSSVCLKEMKWRSNRHFNGLIITVILGAPPPNHSSSECMCDNVHRKCLCTNVIPDLDSEESPSAPVLSEPTILYAAPPSTLAPNNTAAPRRPSPRYGFPIVQSVSRHISTSPCTVFPSLTPPAYLRCVEFLSLHNVDMLFGKRLCQSSYLTADICISCVSN